MSRVHKALGMWSKTHQNQEGLPITACLLHVSFLVASHLLSLAFSPVGSSPLMALFLEPSLYSMSNASESLEQWALSPSAKLNSANCTGIQGNGVIPPALITSLPFSLCWPPPSCDNLSENDRVTLKQQYTPQWVLQQYD